MSAGSTLPGVLLASAAPAKVQSWVRRGVVPAYVLPLSGWTAVVPAGESLALPPYDDGIALLAARPVPATLRTGVGCYLTDRGTKAIVVLHPKTPRGETRWLAWVPERGAMEVPDEQPASVGDLLAAADLVDSEQQQVRQVLARTDGDPRSVLVDLLDALGLPGGDLLAGAGVPTREDAVLVTPSARTVEQFERAVAEETQVRRELHGEAP